MAMIIESTDTRKILFRWSGNDSLTPCIVQRSISKLEFFGEDNLVPLLGRYLASQWLLVDDFFAKYGTRVDIINEAIKEWELGQSQIIVTYPPALVALMLSLGQCKRARTFVETHAASLSKTNSWQETYVGMMNDIRACEEGTVGRYQRRGGDHI
jgi:hypothetical protein